jgi:flagellin-like protein
MRLFRKNELAVSPVIGVILMVAITVILAAVIAAFVFGLGGQQAAAPTASIVAANNPDTTSIDLKIQHKGGDTLKGGDWKISIVPVGQSPVFVISQPGNNLAVGAQIITSNVTTNGSWTDIAPQVLNGVNVTNTLVYYPPSATGCGGNPCVGNDMMSGTKYDVKLVHVPSNAMLLDTVVEVR